MLSRVVTRRRQATIVSVVLVIVIFKLQNIDRLTEVYNCELLEKERIVFYILVQNPCLSPICNLQYLDCLLRHKHDYFMVITNNL